MRRPGASRPRRRLAAVLVPVAAVIVLAAGWVGLWYFGASVADRTLAGWLDREAAAGRVYSCGSQSIGGFPLRIEVRCADATATIKNLLPPLAVKAAGLTFTAAVWSPTRLVGEVAGPLTLADLGQAPNLAADWSLARLTVRGVPPDPDSVAVQLDAAHLDRVGNSQPIFQTKHADLQGHLASGTARDHPVVEVSLQLTGATAPQFHSLLAEPVDAELYLTVRGLKDLSPKPWADRFREMQSAPDSGIELKSLRMTRGDIVVVGTGTVNVNAHGKLDGLVRVAIVGIERLVPLIGIDRLIAQGIDRLAGSSGAAAQGVSALDRLVPGLGGALRNTANATMIENLKKMGEPTSIDGKPALVLPLRFADGSVYFGMLRLGEVPPLF